MERAAVRAAAAPGVRLSRLDAIARDVLAEAGATSPFLGYQPLATTPPFPPARSVVPYVSGPGSHCYWEMHDRSEKWKRGGIVPGDQVPVVHFVDHAFDSWDENLDHQIEISVGDPARRLSARAWTGSGNAEMPGMIGFDLSAELRKLIGAETQVEPLSGKASAPGCGGTPDTY